MKTLSRHSDTAKAFAYLLKQWDALNVYCSHGWVEVNNITGTPLGSGRRPEKLDVTRGLPTAVVNMRRCCTR